MTQKILLLNGPNLNLLGTRETHIYGTKTLADIENMLSHMAEENHAQCSCLQSNAESVLIDRLHLAREDGTQFIIINPAAFTHTSIALRDAFLAVDIPFIEVHLSNIHTRESFRQHSYLSDIAQGVICGLGYHGYVYAMQQALYYLAKR